MTHLDDRTMANLDVVLEDVCRSMPHGGDHQLRKLIAERLLDSALAGNRTLAGLTEVAKAALAEATQQSA
ncbi:hypothetical protein ABIB00_003903 [Bradyrhizobium sp. LB14.3]|uniref:hypothetical protein n=1 Tax=Bradyrhizobium sp. LB14.3 TaxID=3156328 RepID=UPI003394B30A